MTRLGVWRSSLPYNPVWGAPVVQRDARVAEAWMREVESRPEVAAELRAVAEAARARLGEDGARELTQG